MSDARPTAAQAARRKASSAFHDKAQAQITAETKRIEDQALAHRRMVAKTEALRALRLQRDAGLAAAAAAEEAAKPVAAKKRVKKVAAE